MKGLITTLLFLLLCFACNRDHTDTSEEEPINDLIHKYLQQYSPGYLSVKDGVALSFKSEYVGDRSGTEVKGVRTKPHVSGNFSWVNSNTLRFKPDEPLAYDRSYELIVDLPSLLQSDDIEDDELVVKFKTAPLHLKAKMEGLKIEKVAGVEKMSYRGTIQSSDYIDAELVESFLNAIQDNKELSVEWNHRTNGKIHEFIVRDIVQFEEISTVVVSWKADQSAPKFKGNEEVEIKPIGVFELINVNLSSSSEKIISVSFTRPIDVSQNLNGLISINDEDAQLKTEVEGNMIYIYPSQILKEDFSLYISDNIRNVDGKRLGKENLITKLRFELQNPEIRTIGNGIILPNSVDAIFPIETVNLRYIDVEIFKIYSNNILQYLQENGIDQGYYLDQVGKIVYSGKLDLNEYTEEIVENEWSRIGLNLSELIDADLGAIYQIRLGYQMSYSINDCDQQADEIEYSLTNRRSIMDYTDQFYDDYQGRSNPCSESYYNPERFIRRNIISSDVGVIVKRDQNNTYHLALTSLSTGEALSEAKVYLYDFQQQLIAESFSSNSGLMSISADEKASFAVVVHDLGYAYVKLNDESSNSLTEFDVSGVQSRNDVNVFLYADRGVHRPGDTIFLNAMITTEDDALPGNHPVKIVVKDPKGVEKYTETRIENVGGIFSFHITTDQKDITGNWNAELSIGPKKFRKNLRVESVKPNRLKVHLDLPSEIAYFMKSNRQIDVSSQWLHGAPAANLDVEIDGELKNISPQFDGLKEYEFSDPAKVGSRGVVKLFKEKLNESGKAVFNLKLNRDLFPGKVRANLKTRVFEQGGGFSENYASITISPFSQYVGVKSPKSRWGSKSVKIGEDASFKIVTVDNEGKKVGKRRLSVGFYNIDWRWWYYEGDRYNIYKLNSAEHKEAFHTETIVTDATGQYDFNYDFQDTEYGRKMIRVCDLDSGHCTGDFFYARGWGRSLQAEERNSLAKLNFVSDKNQYLLGEEVLIKIPSEVGSKILVSLESGSKVLHQEWVTGEKDQTEYTFRVNEEMIPNIYVHAVMVQSYDQKNNDLPIRMYGVIPIGVDDADTQLKPKIEIDKKLKPKEKFEVVVSELNQSAMSYTVAIVDDGLLDLTNFSTPDPHQYFYAKQAHGITTWDLYNHVMTGFSGDVDKIISVGGDGENADEGGAKKAIRFKPVVMTAGPFYLGKGEKQTHQFTMPNYIGSVRTMVVAKSEEAYGHTDQTSVVNKPLMILPTLPRVISPGEQIRIPTTVFAMEDNIRTVEVTIESSDNIRIVGPASQRITFDSPGEQMVYFDAIVKEDLGIAQFNFLAQSGIEKIDQQIEIEIRNPNPVETQVYSQAISSGESWVQTFDKIGMEGTSSAIVEFSAMPSINLENRMSYLIRYPYGCIEQTTSSVFPQLALEDLRDLTNQELLSIKKNINGGVRRLAKMQLSNGGFSYWPGSQNANEWGTSYAGHFLLRAKEKTYHIPSQILPNWAKYQSEMARRFKINRSDRLGYQQAQIRNQAYRLYTLAMYGTPILSSMNILRQETNLPATSQFMLAAAYALAGKKDIAIELIRNTKTSVEPYKELSLTYGSDLRDMALIAQCLKQLDRTNQGAQIVKRIADDLNSNNWYSTQTVAQALITVVDYTQGAKNKGLNFSFDIGSSGSQIVQSDKAIYSYTFNPDEMKQLSSSIANNGEGTLFVNVNISGQKAPNEVLESQAYNRNISLSINYEDLNGKSIDPTVLKRGTDFIAHVTIKNQNSRGRNIENLALTQLFPSGWEIQSGGLSNVSGAIQEDSYDYRDVRDDRVDTFFSLKDRKDFKILLTAAYDGTYFLPPVRCEAMYDNEIQALTTAQKIKVIAP